MSHLSVQTEWQYHNDLHPLPGDKIEFQRAAYSHVGIADGNGGVYHFNTDQGMCSEFGSKSKAGFRLDKISQVAKGCKVRINNSSDRNWIPLDSSEIIRRCEQELGKGHGTYKLITGNNCEHKANEMRYGTPFSPQLEQVATATVASGVVVVVFMAIATFISGLVSGGNRQQPSRR